MVIPTVFLSMILAFPALAAGAPRLKRLEGATAPAQSDGERTVIVPMGAGRASLLSDDGRILALRFSDDCLAYDVRLPRVLLGCTVGSGFREPRLLNVSTGSVEDLPERNPGTTFSSLGRRWLMGDRESGVGKGSETVFLNWRTGEVRHEYSIASPQLKRRDLDSPDLRPVLHRCPGVPQGRSEGDARWVVYRLRYGRPLLLRRCRGGVPIVLDRSVTDRYVLGKRAVAWIRAGRVSMYVFSKRRSYALPDPGVPPRVLTITGRFLYVSYDVPSRGLGEREVYRATIPSPSS